MQDLSRLNDLIDKAASIAGNNKKLAEQLGVHQVVLSQWKSGAKSPSPEVQGEMAKIAGVDPSAVVALAAVEKTGDAGAIAFVRRLMESVRDQSILIMRSLAQGFASA